MAPLVQEAYGPTLPELVGPRRWRLLRPVIAVVAVLAVVLVVLKRGQADEHVVVVRGASAFNFIYDPPLRRVGPAEVAEVRSGGLFVQSALVRPLALPAYHGDPGGVLPVVADRLTRERRVQFPGLVVIAEGRARINDNPGYYVAWQATLARGRVLFARDYLLVPGEELHPVRGANLELRSTYGGGVSSTDDVGRIGALKKPLRSFRFGTERP